MTARIGDRVVVRDDLPPERELALRERGVPLGVGGYVNPTSDWIDAAGIRLVRFANDVFAFVRNEDLQVLVTHAEAMEERARLRQARSYRRMAERAIGYTTPETVEQAFRFGRRGAYYGHDKLHRSEFLLTAQDHPFPESLFRAYNTGYRQGKRERRDKERAGEFVPEPPERRERDSND